MTTINHSEFRKGRRRRHQQAAETTTTHTQPPPLGEAKAETNDDEEEVVNPSPFFCALADVRSMGRWWHPGALFTSDPTGRDVKYAHVTDVWTGKVARHSVVLEHAPPGTHTGTWQWTTAAARELFAELQPTEASLSSACILIDTLRVPAASIASRLATNEAVDLLLHLYARRPKLDGDPKGEIMSLVADLPTHGLTRRFLPFLEAMVSRATPPVNVTDWGERRADLRLRLPPWSADPEAWWWMYVDHAAPLPVAHVRNDDDRAMAHRCSQYATALFEWPETDLFGLPRPIWRLMCSYLAVYSNFYPGGGEIVLARLKCGGR